jgi:hypothetical protein
MLILLMDMEQQDIIAAWERRAQAANVSMAEVRREAKIHGPNFTNWKKGKTGITLASIQKMEAALARFERSAA